MRLSCAGVRSRGSGRRDWRREGRNAETQTVSEAHTPARNLTRRASHAFRNASRESGHPSLKARSRGHVPPRTCLEAACRSIPPSNARVFSRPADARDDAVGSIHPARATSGRAPRTVRWLLKKKARFHRRLHRGLVESPCHVVARKALGKRRVIDGGRETSYSATSREANALECQSVGALDRTRLPPPSGSRFPVGSSRARASPPSPRTSRAVASRDLVAAESSFRPRILVTRARGPAHAPP